jgi:Na+-translocating ferredoxin:NAD+ oxidoreductase RnfG subunit
MRSSSHGSAAIRRAGHYVCFCLLAAATVAAAGHITRDEALALAFPGAAIRAERLFLTPAQQKAASAAAGEQVASALVARYLAAKDGRVVGRAYVDTAMVRTKNETLLISLDAAGRVRRIDVTAFLEPPEYLPPDAWLRQYTDRTLSGDLMLNKAIRPIAGATLTGRAVNAAVRRVLALDAVLQGDPERVALPERGGRQ